jgi:hypothetical protein
MIPQRFNVEYPQRCLQLLDAMEWQARDKDLLTSFVLMVAASILVIPFERLRKGHPFKHDRGTSLSEAITTLEKERWSGATFWGGKDPGNWRLSRIMGDPNNVARWVDAEGRRSFSPEANDIDRRKAGQVLRALRNALAHGNVVYLNEAGQEAAGTPAKYLAFLSRYEEEEEQRAKAQTYRLIAVTDEDFLAFLRQWSLWLASFPFDSELSEASDAHS